MPERRKEIRYLRYSEPKEPLGEAKPTTNGWMSQLVGGGTVHYGGASFRMDEVDFNMKSQFSERVDLLERDLPSHLKADLKDWPISYKEFSQWYDLAEKIIGIAGAPASDQPALRFNKAGKIIEEALEKNRYPARLVPAPMAVNSRPNDGRDPCHHSGLCQDFACRFEAKSDMRVTTLRSALKTSNLEIIPQTFVRRINKSGNEISSIDCISRDKDGELKSCNYSATTYVIACEAIETNRLLLVSGIGNPSVVGTRLMFHMTGGARSIAPKPTTTWDTAPHTAYIPHYYHSCSDEKDSEFIKAGILLVSSNGGPLQAVRSNWGADMLDFYNQVYPYKMDLSYIGDCLPVPTNRVILRANELDVLGVPGTQIEYSPHPFDQNSAEFVSKKAIEILKLSGGLTKDEAPKHLRKFLDKTPTARRLIHCSGGCRMGDDPADSVVDSNCKVHAIKNLYLADASVFPTGSGVNPTETIQANALRVGAHIASTFNKRK